MRVDARLAPYPARSGFLPSWASEALAARRASCANADRAPGRETSAEFDQIQLRWANRETRPCGCSPPPSRRKDVWLVIWPPECRTCGGSLSMRAVDALQ